jgi:hypothetical protein
MASAFALASVCQPAAAAPLRALEDLGSINIFEITYDLTNISYLPSAPQLTQRVTELTAASGDASFLEGEVYDFFYSRADGSPDPDGSFLTIEAVWPGELNLFGGSMNIGAVRLDFLDGSTVLADFVQSFEMGSTCPVGCTEGSEFFAVDQDLWTFPRFGGTDPNSTSERLRLTVGFSGISGDDDSSATPVPEPESLTLMATGLGAIALRRRRSSARAKTSLR